MDGEVRRVELLIGAAPALSRGEIRPEGLGVVSERRDRADSGHDNASASVHAHACSPYIPRPPSTSKHLARDERGLVRAEKAYRTRYVLRLAETAERGVREDELAHLLEMTSVSAVLM
jgi:hypothetical protein